MKIKKAIIIISISLIALKGFNQVSIESDTSARDFNTKGYELLMEGEYPKAICQFDTAILQDPSVANYYHNRAFCFDAVDSSDLAISDYLQAIKLDPDNYEYYYLLGNIYQGKDDLERASSYYTKALNRIKSKANPDLYIVLFNRGNCYIKNEDYGQAYIDYDSSLILNPNHFPTYANRGIAKIKQSDTIGACYDWYISIGNQISEVKDYYKSYCSAYDFTDSVIPSSLTQNPYKFEQENISGEYSCLTLVEQMPIFPGGDTGRMNYLNNNIIYPHEARMKGIQGRVFISFVIEADGSVTNVEVIRGIGGGCDEEAAYVVSQMPKWKPGFQRGKAVRVQFTMSILFRLNGQGNNYDSYFQKGLEFMDKNKYEKAIVQFSISIDDKKVNYKEAYINRGVSKYELHDFEGALEDFETGRGLNARIVESKLADYYSSIANKIIQEDRYNESIKLFNIALELDPNDADTYYNRGINHYYLGHMENACKDWEKALNLGLSSAQALIDTKCQ